MESDLKMTKEEVREESKQNDGNPLIKSRIRRLQRRMRKKQALAAAATANCHRYNLPTHFAVALRYTPDMPAPLVVSKGQNLLAQQIKALGAEHGIPILENKPLAQALYKTVEVGEAIPSTLYQAVADILVIVFRAQAEVRKQEAMRRNRNASGELVSVMTAPKTVTKGNGFLKMLGASGEWVVPVAAVAMVFVMLVPMPSFLLDLMLTVSITASVLVLLTAVQILKPVEFSVFPSLLLLLTLLRLSLDLASTRRILLHGNEGASAAGSRDRGFRTVRGGRQLHRWVRHLSGLDRDSVSCCQSRCRPHG